MTTSFKLPEDWRRRFHASALTARAEFQRTGLGYSLAEVDAYYRAKLEGRRVHKPRPRLWPR
jgi:hypothetical protein